MHVQVVTYRLSDITDAEFVDGNQEFAVMMAAVPGLLAKIWLKGAKPGEYGGVYLWQDKSAHDAFVSGDLWASVIADETVMDLASADFAAMDHLTAKTQPGLTLLETDVAG